VIEIDGRARQSQYTASQTGGVVGRDDKVQSRVGNQSIGITY